MNRNDIKRLLDEAMKITNYRDYVIIGSLPVFGAVAHPPISMTGSIDIETIMEAEGRQRAKLAIEEDKKWLAQPK